MSATTATVETLTAEVRTLMVGNRQVTLSMAKQLDRFDFHGYGADSIEPFGRIRTGATVTLSRKLDRRPSRLNANHWLCDGVWQEDFQATPWLEVIGRSLVDDHTQGSLIIFEVDRLTSLQEADPDEVARFRDWAKLPLIVLAGLK